MTTASTTSTSTSNSTRATRAASRRASSPVNIIPALSLGNDKRRTNWNDSPVDSGNGSSSDNLVSSIKALQHQQSQNSKKLMPNGYVQLTPAVPNSVNGVFSTQPNHMTHPYHQAQHHQQQQQQQHQQYLHQQAAIKAGLILPQVMLNASVSASSDSSNHSQQPVKFVHATMEHLQNQIKKEEAPKKKRTRTTPEQLRILQKAFHQDQMPNSSSRLQLAKKLGMNARAVQVWFQNRRAKQKLDAKRAKNGGVASGFEGMTSGDEDINIDEEDEDEEGGLSNSLGTGGTSTSSSNNPEMFTSFKAMNGNLKATGLIGRMAFNQKSAKSNQPPNSSSNTAAHQVQMAGYYTPASLYNSSFNFDSSTFNLEDCGGDGINGVHLYSPMVSDLTGFDASSPKGPLGMEGSLFGNSAFPFAVYANTTNNAMHMNGLGTVFTSNTSDLVDAHRALSTFSQSPVDREMSITPTAGLFSRCNSLPVNSFDFNLLSSNGSFDMDPSNAGNFNVHNNSNNNNNNGNNNSNARTSPNSMNDYASAYRIPAAGNVYFGVPSVNNSNPEGPKSISPPLTSSAMTASSAHPQLQPSLMRRSFSMPEITTNISFEQLQMIESLGFQIFPSSSNSAGNTNELGIIREEDDDDDDNLIGEDPLSASLKDLQPRLLSKSTNPKLSGRSASVQEVDGVSSILEVLDPFSEVNQFLDSSALND